MSAATAAAPVSNGSLISLSKIFSPKTPYSILSIPSKPSLKILHLSCSYSSSIPSWFSQKSKLSSSTSPLIALVARTSDWARQDEENDIDEAGFDWKNQQGDEKEPQGEEDSEEDGYAAEEDDNSEEEAKLFIGNLPYDMDSADLADLFNKAGIVETAEVIYNRETDKSRGFGFVTMSSNEETKKAIEMFNRYDINGRLLTVNKAAPRGSRLPPPPREYGPSFKIYVGNIPWQVDDARLEQVFSEHGKVVNARVVLDRDTGRSRGFGFVTMSSQIELEDAIAALDGHSLDGRPIRVGVAEERPMRSSF